MLSNNFDTPSRSLFRSGVRHALDRSVPRGQKLPLCAKLSRRIKNLRERTGISIRQISLTAGLSPATAFTIERESRLPALDTLERIASALGVSPGWLAYGYEGLEPFRERYPRPIVERSDPLPDESLRVFRDLCAGFPDRLRLSRERCGLSMRSLSAAAGVSVQAWSIAEGGRVVPRVDTAERMAVALGVAPSWLAFGEGIVN